MERGAYSLLLCFGDILGPGDLCGEGSVCFDIGW